METMPSKLIRYYCPEPLEKKKFYIDFNHCTICIEVTAGFEDMFTFEEFLDSVKEDK